MAWHAIDPAVPGEVIAASWFNEQVGENLTALRGGGLALSGQAVGDLLFASSTTQFGRLALPAATRAIRTNTAGTAWEYYRTVGVQELFLPCTAFRPGTNSPCGIVEKLKHPSTNTDWFGMPFTQAGYNSSGVSDAVTMLAVPKAWNEVAPQGEVWWAQVGSGSGTVRWDSVTAHVGHAGAIGTDSAWGQFVTSPALGNNGQLVISPRGNVAFGGAVLANQLITLSIRRYSAGGAGDTFTNTAYFIGLKLFFTTDATTDD